MDLDQRSNVQDAGIVRNNNDLESRKRRELRNFIDENAKSSCVDMNDG